MVRLYGATFPKRNWARPAGLEDHPVPCCSEQLATLQVARWCNVTFTARGIWKRICRWCYSAGSKSRGCSSADVFIQYYHTHVHPLQLHYCGSQFSPCSFDTKIQNFNGMVAWHIDKVQGCHVWQPLGLDLSGRSAFLLASLQEDLGRIVQICAAHAVSRCSNIWVQIFVAL